MTRRWSRAVWVDLAGATALAMLAGLAFRTSFGGWAFLRPVVAGAVLGAMLGTVSGRRRAPAIVTAAVTTVVVFVAGPFATVPWTTFAWLPTLTSTTEIANGLVTGWAKLLTIVPPAGNEGNLLVVPFITTYTAGIVGAVLAQRQERVGTVVLPAGGAFFVAVLWGTSAPALLLPQAGGFSALAIAWMVARWHRGALVHASAVDWRKRLRKPAVLAVALAIGAVLASSLPFVSSQRFVLRDVTEPPLDPSQYPSPLTRYPWYAAEDRADSVMFSVTAEQSLGEGAAFRLAAMDTYDGTAFTVSSTGRAGSGVFVKTSSTLPFGSSGEPLTLEVEVVDLRGVWLPVVGEPVGIEIRGSAQRARTLQDALRFNVETRALILPPGAELGDRYVLRTVLRPPPSPAMASTMPIQEGIVQTPLPPTTPTWLGALARDIIDAAGAQTPYERVLAIATALKSNGTARVDLPATHSLYRLSLFLDRYREDRRTPLSGTAEQYTAAMAVLLRSVDVPSRTVVGFEPPPDATTFDVVGADVRAWVEVPFEDVGWIAFDPVPDQAQLPTPPPLESQEPVDSLPPEPPPPPPPLAPLPMPADELVDAEDEGKEEGRQARGALATAAIGAAAVGGSSATGAGLLLLVVSGLKAVRSNRRRRGTPQDQIAAAWEELVDRATDHGRAVPRAGTRLETATLVRLPATVQAARLTDEALFGGRPPTTTESEEVWRAVEVAISEITASESLRQRLQARLNLRSVIASRSGGRPGPARSRSG